MRKKKGMNKRKEEGNEMKKRINKRRNGGRGK